MPTTPPQEQDPMASPAANFLRTAPFFSAIYGAGRRGGQVIYRGGQAVAERTGIQPTIPQAPESGASRENPVETLTLYPIYEAGHRAAEWWNEQVASPYAGYVAPLKEKPGLGQLSQFATGLVRSPGLVAEFGGMILPGAERLGRETRLNPTAPLGYLAAGIVLQGKSIEQGARERPWEFAGEMVGMALVTEGVGRGIRAGYGAIQPRISELGIMARTSPKSWRATHATVNLYKDIYGIESRLRAEPNLGLVKNIGPERGPAITDFISKQEHTIFGRTTEIGQMPRELFEARGGTKDIDIFTTNIKGFQKGAIETLGRDFTSEGNLIVRKAGGTSVDIHSFPEKYPIGKSIAEKSYDVARPALNPLPKSRADILFGKKLVQEKLYIQGQRKAVSTVGESTGLLKFRQGPQLHRLKDVYDLMRTSSYLGKELEVKTAGMSRLDPRTAINKYKTARIERSIGSLKEFYGKPENIAKYKDAGEFGKAIRQFKYGETKGIKVAASPTKELMFTKGRYTHPFEGKQTPSFVPAIASRGMSSVSSLKGIRSTSVIPLSSPKTKKPSPVRQSSAISIQPSIMKSIIKSPPTYRSPPSRPYSGPPSRPSSPTPPYNPPYNPPYTPPKPPSYPPSIPPATSRSKSITWLPEKDKKLFKRIASVNDLGWKITNPVPNLGGFGKIRRFRFK